MSKYKPLADFLAAHTPDQWRVAFDDLEKTLGSALPKTAREKAGWWSNDDAPAKPHAKAWLEAGWLAHKVDLAEAVVTFMRAPKPDAAAPEMAAPDPTAHVVMAAAEAEFEKTRAVETAAKVGVAAAVVGVLAGVGLLVRNLLGRRSA